MSGQDGFGTLFARGNGASPEVFTTLAGVTSIDGPGLTRNVIDVSAHDSPNGYMQFRGGMRDPGEVSLKVNYQPSSHDALVADLDVPDPINYRMTFPNGATWTFPAVMKEFKQSAPYDNKLTADISFKVSGKPTITPGV